MKKSFNKKLSLKKTDIATLSDSEMKSVVGGYKSVQGAHACAPRTQVCNPTACLCTASLTGN